MKKKHPQLAGTIRTILAALGCLALVLACFHSKSSIPKISTSPTSFTRLVLQERKYSEAPFARESQSIRTDWTTLTIHCIQKPQVRWRATLSRRRPLLERKERTRLHAYLRTLSTIYPRHLSLSRLRRTGKWSEEVQIQIHRSSKRQELSSTKTTVVLYTSPINSSPRTRKPTPSSTFSKV